jgi:hypothetical protein
MAGAGLEGLSSVLLGTALLQLRSTGSRWPRLVDSHRGPGLVATTVVKPVVPRGLGHLAQPWGVDDSPITSISPGAPLVCCANDYLG